MHTDSFAGRTVNRLAPVLAIALVVAACGGGGGIKTSGAWARTSPMVAGAGAAYVVIENTGSAADAIVGAASDVAKATEIHETYEMPPASAAPMASAMPAASGTGTPMMGMRKVDRLDIPAGGKVELKPGGYHIMLIDLVRELKAGEKVEITLKFEKAGDVKITAEVRAE